jgi:hypothetical protein
MKDVTTREHVVQHQCDPLCTVDAVARGSLQIRTANAVLDAAFARWQVGAGQDVICHPP